MKNMDKEYQEYIENHKNNVKLAYQKYGELLIKETGLDKVFLYQLEENIENHDTSKFSPEEFIPYRMRFFPNNEYEKIDDENILFKRAWLHHQNINPHHPEFWILRDDDKQEILDMPIIYVIEMLCDWEAMSMHFKTSTKKWWYDKGCKKQFSNKTRKLINDKLIRLFD